MRDTRHPLPPGTKIGFESGSVYEISGEPIGFGGGSIIYPAVRYAKAGETAVSDGFDYVLKECFPVCAAHGFTRRGDGEIVPETESAEAEEYLRLCKTMQLREEAISKSLYRTAIHALPIKESAQREECVLPGRDGCVIGNVFTVMDSLSLKGTALSSCVRNRMMLPLRQCFSVVRQLLYALKEIHGAGFLHLDVQTGNIFIQGSLTEGESILTLIDFGCARPLTDGHTDMISDRIVFATQGFAAPEILLHNDGTLVLTPAADIYSAGCVLLNLLTGKRYTSSELISNRSGRYIDAMKLYRINCPRHLTDKLQHIIAKALENEPSERYSSADEMLEDVEAFLNALPLTVTPLSGASFSAFISYRHGDIDSRAALEVQKRLERFRAPKDISAVRRPFRRCYVDEGELSSGYDYAKQLREVLRNSEWLIVICSPGTGDSHWVNEEIGIFLEYHDRSRVLALLTGGEPEQSFPPRLLEEAPGGDLLIAADARGKTLEEVLGRIRGDALLKLAAPMLSTTFDSLRQREKVYRLRRAAGAAAVMAVIASAFGVYAADRASTIAEQAERIEEEYKAALLNESMFLTEQASKLLEADDTTGAIELALRALPSEAQDRPVLADAEKLLADAVGAYVMPGYESTFKAVKRFSAGNVYKMFACGDGEHILTLEDEYKRVCVRDIDFRLIDSVYFSDGISSLDFSPERLIPDRPEMLISSYSELCRWNYESGELTQLSDKYIRELLLSSDGSYAAVTYIEYDESYNAAFYIALMDTRTGEISKSCLLDDNFPEFERTEDLLIFDPDEKGLFFSLSDSLPTFQESALSNIFYLDLSSGAVSEVVTVPDYVRAIKVIDNYLVGCSSYDLTARTGEGIFNDSRAANLFIFDLEKGETVCCFEVERFGVGYDCRIEAVDFDDGNGRTKAAAFVFADFCELLDLNTGEKLRKYDFGSPVILSRISENGVYAILRNGCMTSFDFTEKTVTAIMKYFLPDLENVCIPADGGHVFVRTLDAVVKYEFGSYDENFTGLAISSDTCRNIIKYMYESGGVLSRFVLLDGDRLYVTDTRENTCAGITLPSAGSGADGYYDTEISLSGSSPDGEYFYLRSTPRYYSYGYEYNPGEFGCYIVSLRDESAVLSEEPIYSDNSLRVEDAAFFDGRMYYAASEESGGIRLCSWIPGSADVPAAAVYDCPDGCSFVPSSLGVTDRYIRFALKSDSGEDYIFAAFDRSGNRFLSVSGAFPDTGAALTHEVLWDTYIWDIERGEAMYLLCTMADDGSNALSLCIRGADGGSISVDHAAAYLDAAPNKYDLYRLVLSPLGRLFAVDDGGITEYSRSGEVLNRIESSGRFGTYLLYKYFDCSFIGDELMVVSVYPVTAVIDLGGGSAALETVLGHCVGFDELSDSFIVFAEQYDNDNSSRPVLGSFHRYSAQELIEMGRAVIG